MNSIILIKLLLAHILTDFVFQSSKVVEKKKEEGLRSGYFWMHISLSGIITYLLIFQWENWFVPLFITVAHGLTDYWKIGHERKIGLKNSGIENKNEKISGISLFIKDQLLHLITLIIAWIYLTQNFGQIIPFIAQNLNNENFLVILTSFIFIIWPVGIVIGKLTEPFRNEFSKEDSLRKAGTYIGISERMLVLIFILLGQYAAIGFLIAAKSILRLGKDGEEDARKKTEYVLIGTLLSFTTAIIVGLLASFILKS